MNKKKCLIVLPRPLFPNVSGYAKKNYNLVKILSKHYDLKLIVICEKELLPEEMDFYNSYCYSYNVCIFSKWRYYLNSLLALFSSKPLQVGYFYFPKVQKIVTDKIVDCDIAVGCLLRTIKYIENSPVKVIRVFEMVDSVALIYSKAKGKTSSLFWKFIYSVESRRLEKYEKRYIQKSNVTFLVNQEECNILQKYGNVKWVPHGVNEDLFKYDIENYEIKNYVSFIGKMDYQPNIDAVKWYLENVQSKIDDKVGFLIIGADPTDELYSIAKKFKNVKITGFVDNPFILLCSGIAVVAPMQTGGGIQNKVLEAMALGKVNIISTLTAKSIVDAKDGEHFIIADTPEQYCETIISVKSNPDKYKQIGKNARKHISDKFTWKAFEDQYIKGINEL